MNLCLNFLHLDACFEIHQRQHNQVTMSPRWDRYLLARHLCVQIGHARVATRQPRCHFAYQSSENHLCTKGHQEAPLAHRRVALTAPRPQNHPDPCLNVRPSPHVSLPVVLVILLLPNYHTGCNRLGRQVEGRNPSDEAYRTVCEGLQHRVVLHFTGTDHERSEVEDMMRRVACGERRTCLECLRAKGGPTNKHLPFGVR